MKQQHLLITIIIFIFITFYGSSYAMEQTEQTDTIIQLEEIQPKQIQTGWFNTLVNKLFEFSTQLWAQPNENFIEQVLEQDSFNKEVHTQFLDDVLLESIRINKIEKIIKIITLLHQKFPNDSTLIQTNTARLIHDCITNYQQDYIITMNGHISAAQEEIPQILNTQLSVINTLLQHSTNILHTYKTNHDQKIIDFYNSYINCKQTLIALHTISNIDTNEQVSLNYCSDLDEENKIHPIENYTYDKVTKKIQNFKKCATMIKNIESIQKQLITTQAIIASSLQNTTQPSLSFTLTNKYQ